MYICYVSLAQRKLHEYWKLFSFLVALAWVLAAHPELVI